MNEQVFRELYNERSKYPLGSRTINPYEKDYIRDELNRQSSRDHVFLLLPAFFFDKVTSQKAKEELESKLSLVGTFDISSIFHPVAGIKFYLYVFGKHAPRLVWFGEILNGLRPFKHRKQTPYLRPKLFPEYGELESYYLEYLRSIDLAIHDDKKSDYVSEQYRMFGVDPVRIQDRAHIDFYKPELMELEAKYAHEDTVRLGDIADIIRPNERQESGDQLFSIKLSDALYPLRSSALVPVREDAHIAKVRSGDIVTNRFLNSAYQNLTKRQDIVIANSQMIIRLHDKRFNTAYLTTYLNSERMRVYFERRKRGVAIQMITSSDLSDFPIVVPSTRTNQAAKNFLNSIGEFNNTADLIKAIDQVLFAPNPLLDKPLQNELLAEMRTNLQTTKNIQIRELFDLDLHEIEKCYKSGAYKACLVLCGSLLEALILDWLSEIDKHNYFEDTDITNLENLINKLRSAERLSQHEAHMAHDIRKKRNLIHPKNYIANTPLEKSVCEAVLNDLKPLVVTRYKPLEALPE